MKHPFEIFKTRCSRKNAVAEVRGVPERNEEPDKLNNRA